MNKGDNHFLNVCVGRGVMYSDAEGEARAKLGGGGGYWGMSLRKIFENLRSEMPFPTF